MKRKNIKSQVKQYFFQNPTSKLRVREIERILQLPLPSIIRYCTELSEEGILTALKTGKVVFYTANRTSKIYLLEKRLNNIRILNNSGLIEYIRQELSNPPVILFGSFSKGEDVEDSDIDLYVETHSDKKLQLDKFEKNMKRKIQVFRYKNLKTVDNPHLANNIINGITLNSYVEVFR